MSQLITMRRRIKAVETIKKITHAMRLISMSTHTRLRHKKVDLERYKDAFQSLWARLQPMLVCKESALIPEDQQQHLIIVIGSQKGLCGNFNSNCFRFLDEDIPELGPNHHVIAVGKNAGDYCALQKKGALASYNDFSITNFVTIAQSITNLILESPIVYDTVTTYSNYQRNFFVQKPRKTVVIPFEKETPCTQPQTELISQEEYIFEQSPEELTTTIRRLMLTVTLEEILFDSLLAEHAARFISMDSSTRNAENLLVDMRLEYNKTRQAAITRELTELATNY